MARTDYVNSDGLKRHFGSSTKPYANNVGKFEDGTGYKKAIVCDFDYTALPTRTSTDTDSAFIPAGSIVTNAYLFVDQAWTGLTDLTAGFVRADGSTAIDIDGILSATLGAQANLTAGLIAQCDGALVPQRYVTVSGNGETVNVLPVPVVLGYDAYLEAYANGTATAGSARIVIEYIEPFTAVIV